MLLLSQLFRNVSLKKEKNYPLYVHRNILYVNDKKLQRYQLENIDTYSCISVPLFILKKSQHQFYEENLYIPDNRKNDSLKSVVLTSLIILQLVGV